MDALSLDRLTTRRHRSRRGAGTHYCNVTIRHDNSNHSTSNHASKSWRSDGSPSCLGGSSQLTRAHFGGKAMGCSPTAHRCPDVMGPSDRQVRTLPQASSLAGPRRSRLTSSQAARQGCSGSSQRRKPNAAVRNVHTGAFFKVQEGTKRAHTPQHSTIQPQRHGQAQPQHITQNSVSTSTTSHNRRTHYRQTHTHHTLPLSLRERRATDI